MKVTLFGRTKSQTITNFAVAGIGLLVARWALQPIASADEAKHDPSDSLQRPLRTARLHDRYVSAETTDRAQYRLSLSIFKHVIQKLENSTGTAVEGSF